MMSNFRTIAFWIAVVIAALLHGRCTHAEIVKPNYVSVYEGKSIVVCTKGGSRIYFEEGKYSMIERLGNRLIKGEGKELDARGSGSIRPFAGEIYFDEINNIEVTEISSGPTIALVTITVGVVVYLLTHPPIIIMH